MWKSSAVRVPVRSLKATSLSSMAVAVALGLASASACSSKPKDEPRKWELTFDEAGAPIGASLMLGDHVVGQVSAPESYETDRKLNYVRGTVPASFSGDDYSGFELELRTPCGTERVPLTTVTVEGRHDPLLHFDPSQAKSAGSTLVWTARKTEPKVQIGEKDLEVDMDHFVLNGLGCATTHSVTVDGELLGELEVSPEARVGVFIPKDTSTCYEVTVANFGVDGGGVKKTILRGKAAYPFPHDHIDYWYEPVPEILSVNQGTVGVTKVGILEVSCDAASADAPAPAPG